MATSLANNQSINVLHCSCFTILLLPKRKRNVFIFNHMLDLSFHGHKKEHQPIHDQYWPEHGNIKNREEGRKKSHQHRPNTRIPELELWQPPHKWSKFIICLGWQSWPIIPWGLQRCQESQQQIQVEYRHGIRDNIKSFQVEHSDTIYHQQNGPNNPSVQRLWGTPIQKHLIRPLHPMQPLLQRSRLTLVTVMILLPHPMLIYMRIPIHWSHTRTTTASLLFYQAVPLIDKKFKPPQYS